jgi:uncharacterized protein (DUF924 family)
LLVRSGVRGARAGQCRPRFHRYHDVMALDALANDILTLWFGPLPHGRREVWFRKNASFDGLVRSQFGEAVDRALAGAFRDWSGTPHGALARVLLLDQFTRNLFRNSPRAFAGDAAALATATAAVDAGGDRALDAWERWFLYLPFEHAEDGCAQQRSLALFAAHAAETGDRGPLAWAEKHAAIIRRFGRFPHRNALLGRASTPEEIAFLTEPGSRF